MLTFLVHLKSSIEVALQNKGGNSFCQPIWVIPAYDVHHSNGF
jgi:hypothetical protein